MLMDYIANFRLLKASNRNIFIEDLFAHSKLHDFVYSIRNFNTKSANLGETENFQPLILLNSFSNHWFGLDKAKKQIVYALILGANFISPLSGILLSSSYFACNFWSLYKSKRSLREPRRGFHSRLISIEIAAEATCMERPDP